MNQSFRVFLTAFLFCLFGVCGALAGELENRLIDEAVNGNVDAVRALLSKDADVNAKDSSGETALMKASYYGYTELVSLLVEKGASVEIKNSNGETALQLAQLKNHADIVNLLQNALSKDPRANFTEYFNDFQKSPWDDANREKVVKAAIGLPALPPVPDEAKQLFLQASALIKTSTYENLWKPIEQLNKALAIAPWWSNAYYNLARALELSGKYDDAIKQLNYYLELKPSESEAIEARAHIATIQAEKENAWQAKQQNENLLAVKYVSGGITRLRYDDAPKWWHDNGRMDALYTYQTREEEPFYTNVFRMPNGSLLTISLLALSSNGAYTGDRVAVLAWNTNDGGCAQGFTFAFGEHSYTNACGVQYNVSVSNQNEPNAFVLVTYTPTAAAVTRPISLLYRGRALRGTGMWGWGSCGDGKVYQAGHDKGGEVLHFECSVVNAALDPNVNALGLTPTTVAPIPK